MVLCSPGLIRRAMSREAEEWPASFKTAGHRSCAATGKWAGPRLPSDHSPGLKEADTSHRVSLEHNSIRHHGSGKQTRESQVQHMMVTLRAQHQLLKPECLTAQRGQLGTAVRVGNTSTGRAGEECGFQPANLRCLKNQTKTRTGDVDQWRDTRLTSTATTYVRAEGRSKQRQARSSQVASEADP